MLLTLSWVQWRALIVFFAIAIMPLYAASSLVAATSVHDQRAAQLGMNQADRCAELTRLMDASVGQSGCEPSHGKTCCPGCYLAIDNVLTVPWDDPGAGLFVHEIDPQRDPDHVFRPPKST